MSGLILLAGCQSRTGTTAAAGPTLKLPAVTLAIAVVDAKTGAPVATSDLSLDIYADDSRTILAGPLVNTASGLFSYVPAALLPATYRLVASAPGYETMSSLVTVTPEDEKADGSGQVSAILRMVNQSNPPTAVGLATVDGFAINGVLDSDLTTTTSGTTDVPGSMSVSIPAGTVISGASGNLSGPLHLSAVYHPSSTAGSLESYPAGFLTGITGAGADAGGLLPLLAGGAATLVLKDAAGNLGTTFGTPLTITIPIPEGTLNPATAGPVQAGDTVPIWSFGADGIVAPLTATATGAIVTGTLGAKVAPPAPLQAYFPVTFATDHFTTFCLAWPEPETADTVIHFVGTSGLDIAVDAWVASEHSTGQAVVTGAGTSTLTLKQQPIGLEGSMTVHIGSGILAINQTFTSGTAQDIDLTPFLASVTATQAQIEALGVCTDTNVRVPLPGVLIWVYTDSDAYPDVRTTDGSGLATFNLRQNTTYRFEVAARVPSATSPGLDDIQTEGFSWTSDGVVGVTLLPVSFDIPCATAGTAGATGTTGAGN